MYTDIS
ncbi:hypothetical protein CGLO_18360 [Colletotrichum gloeosporioides Cg-14]|nr:hypothetical protein CGLO_18360 [Colletotrichum gloeosporioides Cg-14]